MANIFNYASNTTTLSRLYKKYTVSRIITNQLSDLLKEEIPAEIPNTFHIQISLYSLADNVLVYTTTLPSNSVAFNVKTIQYTDGTIRRLLFIDFSKLLIPLPDGRFQSVLNFFVSEIGAPSVQSLALDRISPSRTEVELRLTPEYRTPASASLLVNFASPKISTTWINSLLLQIFNQPSSSTSNNIPTDTTNLTFDIVESFLPTSTQQLISSPDTTGSFTASIKNKTNEILTFAYGFATQSVNALPGSTVYTENLINSIVSSSIGRSISQYNQNIDFTII